MAMMSFRKEVTSSEAKWPEINRFCSTDMVDYSLAKERRLNRASFFSNICYSNAKKRKSFNVQEGGP